MKITKPSELREGGRYKFKKSGLDLWGWAYEDNRGDWYVVGGTGAGIPLTENDYIPSYITDLESYEGIMAIKEGDVLVDDEGSERKVFFANEYIVMLSMHDNFDYCDKAFTYQALETYGYKLKDEQPDESDAEGMPDNAIAKMFKEIKGRLDELAERVSKELEPID